MLGSVTLVIFFLAIVFVVQTVKVVPQQHAWVVERLGKYHATLAPGLNIVVPFIDCQRPRRLRPPDRPEPGRPVPDCTRLCQPGGSQPDAL